MRVLLATVAHPDELLRARKHLGYDRLVVVAPTEASARLEAALADLQGARVERVPEHDLLACLERLESLLREHERDTVRAAVDGGTAAMSQAAFLACLSRGVEMWFLLKQPVRLPVLRARPVEQRFSADQVAVLRALDGKLAAADVARRAGLPEPRTKDALLKLKKLQVVAADAGGAALTPLGAYYRRGLQG